MQVLKEMIKYGEPCSECNNNAILIQDYVIDANRGEAYFISYSRHNYHAVDVSHAIFAICSHCGKVLEEIVYLKNGKTIMVNGHNVLITKFSYIPQDFLSKIICAEKMLEKPYDEALKYFEGKEADFIDYLQDEDLWYCFQCGKILQDANLTAVDTPDGSEKICGHCKEAAL